MKHSIEIRPAVSADMEAVGRLYTDSWQRTYRGLLPDQELDEMTAEASTGKWTSYLERKENAMFVLERSGAVAGFAACRPLPERENSALLDSLHVAPEAQGAAGAGSSLPRQPGGPGRTVSGSWSSMWSRATAGPSGSTGAWGRGSSAPSTTGTARSPGPWPGRTWRAWSRHFPEHTAGRAGILHHVTGGRWPPLRMEREGDRV